ncbi:MAG TPA: hypothetical protein VIE67_12460 [Rudaea sp.]|jgi:hypothetical protein|uniref:hypothetical protein n=1 Tax=Rudaea sp. TaxID=2136325 RepID=UPI002F93ADB0
MGAVLDRISSSARGMVWLAYDDYAAALLAKGVVPWLDVGAYLSWQRQAQGLLKSDVVTLALAPACAAWLDAHASLRAAMAAKSRTVYALKTLLADDELRGHLVELAAALRASQASTPLVLSLPSPRHWPALAYAQAHAGATVEVDTDDADSAAMYIADFLRAFSALGIDGILIEEARDFRPGSAQDLDCYQAVLNVAQNYRWDIGLHLPAGGDGDLAQSGFAFAIAPQASSVPTGLIVPAEFWSAQALPADSTAAFRYAEIPAQTQPERVLDRLTALRQ